MKKLGRPYPLNRGLGNPPKSSGYEDGCNLRKFEIAIFQFLVCMVLKLTGYVRPKHRFVSRTFAKRFSAMFCFFFFLFFFLFSVFVFVFVFVLCFCFCFCFCLFCFVLFCFLFCFVCCFFFSGFFFCLFVF